MSRHDKSKINYTETFLCGNCGNTITPLSYGSEHRNHCPLCLYSRHMDLRPGDRLSGCRGLMEPISIWVKNKNEWSVIHRCKSCGFIRPNRIAGDDNEILLFALAAKALTMMPFPFDRTFESISSVNSLGGSK